MSAPEQRLVASYLLPSFDAAVAAVLFALREEAAPAGMRIYDAGEAAKHFSGLVLPPGNALLVTATAGPTDLAACDRDLITSAVVAEGGTITDTALADLWWRRLHAGEPTPGPAPTLQIMATQINPQARGASIATFAFAFFAGQTVGVFIASFAYDRLGAPPLFAATAVMLPLMVLWFRARLARRLGA